MIKLPITQEMQAIQMKEDIIKLARDKDLDSEVVVVAMADVLGLTASMLDRKFGRMSLDDRLHTFNQRVEQAYKTYRTIGG